MPLPAFILPALAGAAMGAGRTFLDRNKQKDPWSYLSNGVQGAVGGAFGGLPGAFQAGGMGMGGGSVLGSLGNMIGQEFLPKKQIFINPRDILNTPDPGQIKGPIGRDLGQRPLDPDFYKRALGPWGGN